MECYKNKRWNGEALRALASQNFRLPVGISFYDYCVATLLSKFSCQMTTNMCTVNVMRDVNFLSEYRCNSIMCVYINT